MPVVTVMETTLAWTARARRMVQQAMILAGYAMEATVAWIVRVRLMVVRAMILEASVTEATVV